jgi:hypothetical protein
MATGSRALIGKISYTANLESEATIAALARHDGIQVLGPDSSMPGSPRFCSRAMNLWLLSLSYRVRQEIGVG